MRRNWSSLTSNRCRRGRRRRRARTAPRSVHPELGTNLAGEIPAAAIPGDRRLRRRRARRHRDVSPAPLQLRADGATRAHRPGTRPAAVDDLFEHPGAARGARQLRRLLGLPEARIRVIMGDVGGAFGQKMFPMREDFAVVLAARRLGRPVKWIEDRNENLVGGGHAREEDMTVSLAIDGDGRFTAITADQLENVGAYPFPGNGSTAGAGIDDLPGAVPHSADRLRRACCLHQHLRPLCVPGSVDDGNGRPRAGRRSGGPAARSRPTRAPAAKRHPAAELPYQSRRFRVRQHQPGRDPGAGGRADRVRRIPTSKWLPVRTDACSVSDWACMSSRHSPLGRSEPRAPRSACCPAARSRSSWGRAATDRASKRPWPRWSPITWAATSRTSPSCRVTPPSCRTARARAAAAVPWWRPAPARGGRQLRERVLASRPQRWRPRRAISRSTMGGLGQGRPDHCDDPCPDCRPRVVRS